MSETKWKIGDMGMKVKDDLHIPAPEVVDIELLVAIINKLDPKDGYTILHMMTYWSQCAGIAKGMYEMSKFMKDMREKVDDK